MKEYVVKSKVYIVPKRRNLFPIILINVCIIILAVVSLFNVIFEGIEMANISSIIVSLIIAIGLKKWSVVEPYYIFSSAQLVIDHYLLQIKYDNGRVVTINIETVDTLEYSDKLECIRFICSYSLCESSATSTFEKSEYLLYLSATEYPEIIKDIEEATNHQVMYVDREQ